MAFAPAGGGSEIMPLDGMGPAATVGIQTATSWERSAGANSGTISSRAAASRPSAPNGYALGLRTVVLIRGAAPSADSSPHTAKPPSSSPACRTITARDQAPPQYKNHMMVRAGFVRAGAPSRLRPHHTTIPARRPPCGPVPAETVQTGTPILAVSKSPERQRIQVRVRPPIQTSGGYGSWPDIPSTITI